MLCCPALSSFRASRWFPGGIASACSSETRFSWSNFRPATAQSCGGQVFRAALLCVPSNTSSVPWFRNDRIMGLFQGPSGQAGCARSVPPLELQEDITYIVIHVKGREGGGGGCWI